ncbi:MAG TPA: single-stranded DNA-binding protein [Pseudonocardia sp.]|jgi:single-strand DNA-binding protein|nr:single-stranded DNA-binding protein [Pseudonocardia sp.]
MNETYLTVRGTLITNIDRRRMVDGTTVVHFRVASNERRYDAAMGDWTDGDTLYLSVTCWRRLAENVHASFVCGDPMLLHGRLFSRSYEKDGKRQWVQEMEAVAVGPDLRRCTAAVTRSPARAAVVVAATPLDDRGHDPAPESVPGSLAEVPADGADAREVVGAVPGAGA